METDSISIAVEIIPKCDPSLISALPESDELKEITANLQGTSAIKDLVEDLGLHPDMRVDWSFTISSSEMCGSDNIPIRVQVRELPSAMEPFRARVADATLDLVELAMGGKQSPALAANLGYDGATASFEVEIGPDSTESVSSEDLAASMNVMCQAPLLFEYSKGCSSWPW